MSVRNASYLALAAVLLAVPLCASAATASVTDAYPSSSVPPGVRVSFIVTGSGFSERPTYKVVDSFPGGVTTVNIDAGGNLAWTPNKDDIGSHGITITLTDSEGTTASASKTITVLSAASVSAAAPTPSDAVAIGTPVSVALTSNGLFSPTYTVGDSVTSSSVSSGRVNAAGVFTWTPLPQDAGKHTLTFTGKDSYGTDASVSKEITVLPSPSISLAHMPSGSSVHAESALTFDIVAEGFVNPSYTVSDDAGPTRSPITVSSAGAVSWTPVADEFGRHTLRVSAHDGTRSATTTVTITVLSPAPTSTPAATPVRASTDTTSTATPRVTTPVGAPVTQPKPKVPVSASQKKAQEAESAANTPPEGVQLAFPSSARDVPEPIVPAETTNTATETPSIVSFADFVWISIGTFFDTLLRRFGL